MSKRALTVIVHGRPVNHALFVTNEELELTLSDIRVLLTDQGVDTTLDEYCFLTANGSALTSSQENMLTLKEICTKSEPPVIIGRETPDQEKDFESLKPEPDPSSSGASLEFSIYPSHTCPTHQGSSKKFVCPFREYKDIFNIHDYMNLKTLFRALIALTLAMACMVFFISCTLHVLASTWGVLEMSSQPMGAPQTDAVTDLKLKLQEVELSVKYKMAEIEKRIGELEDMYLKDLKHHVQEMAALKASVSNHIKQAENHGEGNDKLYGKDVKMEPSSRPDVIIVSPDMQ